MEGGEDLSGRQGHGTCSPPCTSVCGRPTARHHGNTGGLDAGAKTGGGGACLDPLARLLITQSHMSKNSINVRMLCFPLSSSTLGKDIVSQGLNTTK